MAANLDSSSDDDDWVVLESEEVTSIPCRASAVCVILSCKPCINVYQSAPLHTPVGIARIATNEELEA